MPSDISATLLRSQATFGSLCPELLVMVAAQLNSVTDAANYAATSAYLDSLMGHTGWRAFFQSTFPSIRVAEHLRGILGWRGLAGRLAAMDGAWERRSFDIHSYGEYPIAPLHGKHYSRGGRKSVGHLTPVDARLIPGTAEEIVACGAGEDLMVKRSRIEGDRPGRWIQQAGEDNGFSAGSGDITAVSVVHCYDDAEIITGRANGQFHLQRVVGSCIETMERLSLLPQNRGYKESSPSHFNQCLQLDDTAISCMEWEPTSNLLATGQDKYLRLYSLSQLADKDFELEPIEVYDAAWDQRSSRKRTFMNTVKFLNSNTVACGIATTRSPLQWGQLTPDGLRLESIPPYTGRHVGLGLQSVNAIETVGANGKLILSAWCDGAIRLTDLRTPEPFDCEYRNGSILQQPSSSLITHGQERFVAGSSMSPSLHFFDFRSPMKVYRCTDKLPCSADSPRPGRNIQQDEWYAPPTTPSSNTTTACRSSEGITCRRHAASRRADVTVRARSAVFEHVVSLARSCDVSDVFYCGVRGSLLEMRLRAHWTGDSNRSDSRGETDSLARCWAHGGKRNTWSEKQRPRALVTMEETGHEGGYFYAPQSPRSPWRNGRVRRGGAPRMSNAPLLDETGCVMETSCQTFRALWWPEEQEQRQQQARLEPAWVTNRCGTTRFPLTPAASDCGEEELECGGKEELDCKVIIDCVGGETEVESVLSFEEMPSGPDESAEE